MMKKDFSTEFSKVYEDLGDLRKRFEKDIWLEIMIK